MKNVKHSFVQESSIKYNVLTAYALVMLNSTLALASNEATSSAGKLCMIKLIFGFKSLLK